MQLEQYGVYDEMWDDQLITDADGNFELIVSGERPPGYDGNWLHLHPSAGNITVRAVLQRLVSRYATRHPHRKAGRRGLGSTAAVAGRDGSAHR